MKRRRLQRALFFVLLMGASLLVVDRCAGDTPDPILYLNEQR